MSEPLNEHPPLTEEEQRQRQELDLRARRAEWSAREAQRTAQLAVIQPMLDVLPTKEEAQALVSAIEAHVAVLPYHLGERVRRLRTMISIDLIGFHAEVLPIVTPEPQPTDPTAE